MSVFPNLFGLGNLFSGSGWFSEALVLGSRHDDNISVDAPVVTAILFGGDDFLTATAYVGTVIAGGGDDTVELLDGGGMALLGSGDDTLIAGDAVGLVSGGQGDDTIVLLENLAAYDIAVGHGGVALIGRFSGAVTLVRHVENFKFTDITYTDSELGAIYSNDPAVPVINVGEGTQTLTVNDPDPTVSVVWDRTVQQAVIDTVSGTGPTVASRAYAMVHTAIYDAWASYDDTAVRVSFDLEGDNALLEASAIATEDNKAKAMNYAAYTVLNTLFADQGDLFDTVMAERFGHSLIDDGSIEAAIGIDAAEDLIALRLNDGSNQAGGYTGTFTLTNTDPQNIVDITKWTPEYFPIDPDDGSGGQPLQSYLTPQWGGVESFALAENPDGTTDHSDTLPPPPQPFFTAAYADSMLDLDAKTITLSAAFSLNGVDYAAGDTIDVSKALIGTVINQGFIEQAQEVIDYSAELTDRQKIIAEFWEDAGGTAFPPGTFMSFAQFVSARDNHSLDQDAKMFLAMGNAVFDSGIATWHAKTDYDYVRPVRAIRELGELGLIGEEGVDYLGNEGFVITAFAGFDPITGEGLGTQTILASDFIPFQRPLSDPSPPFSEYTSGHSGFSSAGAEVLLRFTGSDHFGGSVTFAPGSTQFEPGVPAEETTLFWDTFSDAAAEAGLSRLYGGIHFDEGNIAGQVLGRHVGANAYDLSLKFIDGTATDADRPFYDPGDLLIG